MKNHESETTWQPIETAPKDGTYVLLYQPDEGGSYVGKDHGSGYMFAGCFERDKWYCTEYTAFEKAPTYWMPLPEKPQATKLDEILEKANTKVDFFGFRITDGKGFHIAFHNGWTISVQFGSGSYIAKNSERRFEVADFSDENQIKRGAEGSPDAEIMIFTPDGVEYDEETPVGYQTPEQFADLVAMIRSKP